MSKENYIHEIEQLKRETIELIKQIYKKEPVGGALHIVLDDDNVADHHILWCLQNSIINEEFCEKADRELFRDDCEYFMKTDNTVEVVRCKDCKYYNENKFTYSGDGYGRCDHPQQAYDDECFDMWVETTPDDYCSYGERRENDR